ncbi:MAG: BrnT family toxin [Acidobacteriota bacterium]
MNVEHSTGFDWDKGNSEKNWTLHRVSRAECEEVFFNRPCVVHQDSMHSMTEDRYYALGRTDVGRGLFVAFTLRGELIRVISARDMTKSEQRRFRRAESKEADPEIRV